MMVLLAVAPAAGGAETDHAAILEAAAISNARQVLLHGDVLYVLLERGGVAVVDTREPRVVTTLAYGRPIARMLLAGETLVLLEVRQEAHTWNVADPLTPVAEGSGPAPMSVGVPAMLSAPTLDPAVPVSASTSPPAVRAPVQAKVLDVRSGRIILDQGAEAGFIAGARVKVLSQRMVSKPDLLSGGTRKVPSNETTAVLGIEHAEAKRAMAMLGRGDVVLPGDVAVVTEEPLSESIFAPRRAPFNLRTGFHIRPFLGINARRSTKPIGVLTDLYAVYYFDALPMAVTVGALPIGVAFGSEDKHAPGALKLTGSYSTDFFEIGLGVGSLVGYAGPCGQNNRCEKNNGLTINQELRLGSLDGFNVGWSSSVFVRPNSFVFGVGRGELNIPLTSRLGLFGGGGGGESGWAFGEFGVRTYVGGAGARGTLVVSVSLGYGSVFDGPTHETIGGPTVALGVEMRQ